MHKIRCACSDFLLPWNVCLLFSSSSPLFSIFKERTKIALISSLFLFSHQISLSFPVIFTNVLGLPGFHPGEACRCGSSPVHSATTNTSWPRVSIMPESCLARTPPNQGARVVDFDVLGQDVVHRRVAFTGPSISPRSLLQELKLHVRLATLLHSVTGLEHIVRVTGRQYIARFVSQ